MDPNSLIEPWRGPFGGVPPLDTASPELIERAVRLAIEQKRAEIAAIIDEPSPPNFANTIEALEDAGRSLRRAETLRAAFVTTKGVGDMPAVQQRLAPLLAAFEDEIWQNDALFARVDAVHAARASLAADQARLTELIRDRMIRRGAGLPAEARARLTEVNAAIAAAEARFQQNLMSSVADEPVWVSDPAMLDGVPEALVEAAARLAAERGRPGEWAFGNLRPTVWPILQFARNRSLRRQVRDMWMMRCGAEGPYDNRALTAEIVSLRGEKARLLGYESYAHFATAARMAGTPEAALAQLHATWGPVLEATRSRRDELQALADADGLGEPIAAWDWLYYTEQLRRARFGLDGQAVRAYLSLGNVLAAIFDAMGRLHGLTFVWREDVPVIHPDVRVVEVRQDDETRGVIWLDLLFRDGKMRSSWQAEMRAAETFRGRVVPFSNVCSNLERQPDGQVLMGFEYANVLFHEFGHALHMIMSEARYPSLGPMAVEWDLVELPSQLNERWLFDRALLKRHARHHITGEPIPDAMIDGIEAAHLFDRVFSAGVEYLAPSIVDMRMYLAANGEPVDPLAVERAVYEEIGMPAEVDPVFRIWNQMHSFTEVYAAGLYVYLWADVMVADVIEAFTSAPGGLYDETIAARWRDEILTAGATRPGRELFRSFRGRDPDPSALLRRFELA